MSTSSSAKSYGYGFWVGLIAVIIIAAGAVGTYILLNKPTDKSIPAWQTDLPFSPLIIGENKSNIGISQQKLSTSEENVKILSYVITTPVTAITVSQYSQPQEFTDIPEYKDRFLSNIAKQYATVQSAGGVIYLGRMTKQDNKQLAVMLEKGLIVFMNPERELSDAQWRQIGDLLEVAKLTR